MGNFLFPHLKLKTKSKVYSSIQSKKNKIFIIPVFEIKKSGIVLDEVITVKANHNFELEVTNSINDKYNHCLFDNEQMYSIFYLLYSLYNKSVLYLMMSIKVIKKRLFFKYSCK